MKTRILVYAICMLAIMTIQSTILDSITIYGVKPNLIIVFIVCVSLISGSIHGGVVGFILGLFQDIISGKIIGIYCLLGMFTGIFTGSVTKRLYRDNILIGVVFVFISSVLYEELVYLYGTVFFNQQVDFVNSFLRVIFPEAIYNICIAIPMYYFALKSNRKFGEVEEN